MCAGVKKIYLNGRISDLKVFGTLHVTINGEDGWPLKRK